MKSNGCRDVQHTGLQSTQTRRNYSSNNTGKQGAQTRGTRAHRIVSSQASLHHWLHAKVTTDSIGCYTCSCAATVVGMLGKIQCDVPECPLFVHLAYQCCCCYSFFLFVCFVGLHAGQPYFDSFENFILFYIPLLCGC